MIISYKKLWKLLIDRDLLKKDLIAMSGISPSSVTKLGHNEMSTRQFLLKSVKRWSVTFLIFAS